MKNSKGFIQIILVLVVIALVGGGMYYFGKMSNKSNVVIETPTEEPVALETQKPNTPTVKPTNDPTAGWKEYTNINGYSLKYPDDWIAKSSVPGPGEIELVSNSRGFTSYQSKYKGVTSPFPRISIDILDPKTEEILGVTDYNSWANYLKNNQFYKVQKVTYRTVGGIEATILEGNFESSGVATYHKNYLTHTTDGKYVSIQIDDFVIRELTPTFDQILSTFMFTK